MARSDEDGSKIGEDNFSQKYSAFFPIRSTDDGMTKDRNDSHLKNALFPISRSIGGDDDDDDDPDSDPGSANDDANLTDCKNGHRSKA